jgi:uncharacterized integral membrane protein
MSTDPQVPLVPPAQLEQPGLHGQAVPELPAATEAARRPAPLPEDAVKFTRAGALWSALIVGFLILILLLVFIMQNTDSTTVHLFGWAWQLPVGVAVLLAAVGGGLLTVLVGTARILQLRRAAKKNLKAGLV